MKIALLHKYISAPRYSRYLTATNNNNGKAKRVYTANIKLAQAFHPILSQFEVIFRNSVNIVLVNHFGDADWIINQKTGFMSHRSLRGSNYFLKTCVQNTEEKLRRRRIPITSGKIIADQTFGFWLALFLPHHYSLIGGQPIHVFHYKPARENRASIYDRLDEVKNFRNRVNHCEPVCFVRNIIDCSLPLEIQTKIYELVEWMNPDLVPFFKKIDCIENTVDQILAI
jgi:hypothetical protein